MNTLIIFLSLIFGGFVAWWGTQNHEKTKARTHIQGLESKLRYERGQAAEMKERVAQIRGEMTALERTLNQERAESTHKITSIGNNFKRGLVMYTVFYFVFGLGLGGVAAWSTATAKAEAKHTSETTGYVIAARSAEEKVAYLEKQISKLEKEVNETRMQAYQELMERQAVETKLGILVESLSPSRAVDGFTLDYQKMKRNLRKQAEETTIGPKLPSGIQLKSI